MTATRWNGVDYAAVGALRAQVAKVLREERRRHAEAGTPLDAADEQQLGWDLVRDATAAIPMATDQSFVDAVHAELFGCGRLQPLLDDPDVTNVEVNGCDRVWVTLTDGHVVAGPPVAESDEELVELVRRLATYGGALSSRPFDPAHPWVELRLPDGSRLCALMSVVERPVVSIRCFRLRPVQLRDVFRWGGFGEQVGAFLEAAVSMRANLMVSGETFSGKTTLVRALGNAIPPHERLVTVEHFRELAFGAWPDLHRDVVEMEERAPNAEGIGAMSMAELVERARRLNPDRLVVGEVIGSEVVAMLDAMTQGEDGSLSTIHARNAPMVFQRIATYALRSGLAVQACHLLTAGALDFVVHLSKRTLPDGRVLRYVSSIREIVGYDGTQVVSSEVFGEGPDATQVPAASISAARADRLAEAGYDDRAWVRS